MKKTILFIICILMFGSAICLAWVIIKADEFVLVKMRFLRAAKIETLSKADLTVLVDTGLISNSITMANSLGKTVCSLTFSKVYSNEIENIRKKSVKVSQKQI